MFVLGPDLYTGTTRAVLRICGNRPVEMDLLKIEHKIGDIRLDRYFITDIGYVDKCDDLFFNFRIIFSTTLQLTGLKKKEFGTETCDK